MDNKLSTDLVNKDRGFTIFGPDELYDPKRQTGFVPNAGDLIKNDELKGFLIVSNVDYAMLTWRTSPWNSAPSYNTDSILGGVNPLKSDSWVIYVDSSQHPATLMCHNAISFNGSDCDSIRIMRGHNYGDDGEILSGYFKNGRLVDTKIPLKTISYEGVETVTKMPLTGSCIAEVEHGEEVLLILYGDNGEISLLANAHISKTNLAIASETPARQIVDMRLMSPFILDENSTVLTLPVNFPIDDIPLSVEVTYTDGKKMLPIDGQRCRLDGLRNSGAHDTYYIASNAGQELPLVLNYRMARGETYAGSNVIDGGIWRDYTATTTAVDGAYSLKLYVVPVWLDAGRGYRLHYYLYNLTRGNVYDATAYVEHVSGSTPFDPLLYNVKQRINVQVDVSKVNPTYHPHPHPQSFHITLLTPGTSDESNFLIDYVHDGSTYGRDVIAEFVYSNVTFSTVDITCGYASMAEWLKALYYDSYPLYDRRAESGAPEPTHFEIHVGGKVYTHPVTNWVNRINVDFNIPDSSSLVIRWLRRTPTLTQQLGMSPMLAHHK